MTTSDSKTATKTNVNQLTIDLGTLYETSAKVSGGNIPEGQSVVFKLQLDFRGCSATELLAWAASNRVIAFQRAMRALPVQELRRLAERPYRVSARNAGGKAENPEDRVRKLIISGWDEDEARMSVYEPDKFQEYKRLLMEHKRAAMAQLSAAKADDNTSDTDE